MDYVIYRTLFVCLIMNCVCLAAPEPAIVPAQDQWTVDVEFTQLQQITLNFARNIEPERFWYTIVTITNNTDDDISFYPKFDLMTDTFQIQSAGTNVGQMVFNKIKERHHSQYPFIENLEKTENIILQGEENAKDIAVIWPNFDKNASSVKLFMSGFSNETATVNHPVLKDDNNEPIKIFLRKTLELSYDIESDSGARSDKNLVYLGKRWIMR